MIDRKRNARRVQTAWIPSIKPGLCQPPVEWPEIKHCLRQRGKAIGRVLKAAITIHQPWAAYPDTRAAVHKLDHCAQSALLDQRVRVQDQHVPGQLGRISGSALLVRDYKLQIANPTLLNWRRQPAGTRKNIAYS